MSCSEARTLFAMRQTAATWWKPAITPVAAALLAFGTGTMAFAGVELVSSSTDAPPAAAPVVTELGEAVDPPVAGEPTEPAPPVERTVDEPAVDDAGDQPEVPTESGPLP